MSKVQWQSVGESEHLKLAIFTIEVNPWKGKWISWIMLGLDEGEGFMDQQAYILDAKYRHSTREDAKNYAIAKVRELLLADLKQLET